MLTHVYFIWLDEHTTIVADLILITDAMEVMLGLLSKYFKMKDMNFGCEHCPQTELCLDIV